MIFLVHTDSMSRQHLYEIHFFQFVKVNPLFCVVMGLEPPA